MKEFKRYRYPGPEYFRLKDQDIFFGRKLDVEKLYTKVMLHNTLVIHAESGIGKSSIVEAGLIPAIHDSHGPNYKIITYRLENYHDLNFDPGNDEDQPFLINQILYKINETNKNIDYKFLCFKYLEINTDSINTLNSQDTLWITAKKLAMHDEKLIIVFDQFEEIQSFPDNFTFPLKKSLAGLFAHYIPSPYYDIIRDVKNRINHDDTLSFNEKEILVKEIEVISDSLDVKLIFVVREDKLGVMSSFSDYFPDILKNEFKLRPLELEDAKEAIKEPAMRNGEFECDRFLITDAAIDKIINDLSDNKTQPVEAFQLQLICREIEKRIINKRQNYIVEADHLSDIKEIIQKYYEDLISELKLTKEKEFILRKILEEVFILADQKRRKLVLSDEIRDVDPITLDKLIDNRLIRSVKHQEKTFYELSHDNLIAPILTNYHNRKKEKERDDLRKKNRSLAIAVFLALIFITSTIISIIMLIESNSARKEIEKINKELDSLNIVSKKNYQNAITAIDKQKETEVKSLLRNAQQLAGTNHYKLALDMIKQSLVIDSTNAEAKDLYKIYYNIIKNQK